jgi:hypothetical protein
VRIAHDGELVGVLEQLGLCTEGEVEGLNRDPGFFGHRSHGGSWISPVDEEAVRRADHAATGLRRPLRARLHGYPGHGFVIDRSHQEEKSTR